MRMGAMLLLCLLRASHGMRLSESASRRSTVRELKAQSDSRRPRFGELESHRLLVYKILMRVRMV